MLKNLLVSLELEPKRKLDLICDMEEKKISSIKE
jgi:hypothetical protein